MESGWRNVDWPESFGFRIFGEGPTYVLGVQRGGTAHVSGLAPGDHVIELDGHDVTDMSADAMKKLASNSRTVPPTIGENILPLFVISKPTLYSLFLPFLLTSVF